MVRIAITGATGFIGGHVARLAIERGHDVTALVRSKDKLDRSMQAMGVEVPIAVVGDMADADAVRRCVAEADAVVHCAATVSLDPRDADAMADANEAGTRIVLEAAVAAGAARMVYVSSSSALFEPGRGPLSVDDPPTSTTMAYGRAKARAERVARSLAAEGGPVSIVYPSAVVGPAAASAFGEAGEGMAGFVAGGAVPTKQGALSLIDVRDLAAIVLALTDPTCPPQRVMCTGHFLDMDAMAELYRSITGRRFPVLPVPAAVLRRSGQAVDRLRRFVSIDSPMSEEGMTVLTDWQGAVDSDLAGLGVELRPAEETLRDAMRSWHAHGLLSDRQAGALLRTP